LNGSIFHHTMMKNKVPIFISFLLLTGLTMIGENPLLPQEIKAAERVNPGAYVEFGTYNEEPILWRVIDQDEEGNSLLYSNKILMLKAFDAKGDAHSDSTRQDSGSNNWKESTLRQWLNSSEARINWTKNEPNYRNVYQGWNPYHEEAGFLHESNFTKEERKAIKSSTITTKSHLIEGGESYTTEDQVFLLSKEEYNNYKLNLLGESQPTSKAVENSSFVDSNLNPDKNWSKFLRTKDSGTNPSALYSVGITGNVSGGTYAYRGSIGVAPALWLNLETLTIKFEEGSEESPHRILGRDRDSDGTLRENEEQRKKGLIAPLMMITFTGAGVYYLIISIQQLISKSSIHFNNFLILFAFPLVTVSIGIGIVIVLDQGGAIMDFFHQL